MTPSKQFHMAAKVIAHLDGGYTRVRLLIPGGDFGGLDYPFWEIPTDCFALELRALGSRVMIHHAAMRPDENDTVDAIRARSHDFVIEPLSAAEEKKLKDAPLK